MITIGVFYRPPNRDLQPLEDLQKVLNEMPATELILIGDFNISGTDWNTIRSEYDSPPNSLLIDTVHDNFLTQVVSQPTRGQNILDLILTSSDYVEDLSVREPFSDHNLITFKINCNP